MIEDVMTDAEARMEKTLEVLRHDLASIRTGRASPALVEELEVDYYGSPTPLNQLATIGVPESRLIVIRPYDPTSIEPVERAILKSDLGLTPSNDGKIVRLTVPPLTEERRGELGKMVGKRVEEARVAIRNIRRDGLHNLKSLEDEKEISEDEHFRTKDRMQRLTDRFIESVNEIGDAKEAEVREI